MDDADLLMVLDGDLSAGPGATIVFGEGLELLAAGLSSQLLLFGLAVKRLRDPGAIDVTAMGGWRTPNAIWLADLSAILDGDVRLFLASRALIEDILGDLLGGVPDDDFAMDTPHTADALAARLAEAPVSRKPAVAAPEPLKCDQCGVPLQPGWRFCGSCQSPVLEPDSDQPTVTCCPNCGREAVPGARFCGKCRSPVLEPDSDQPAVTCCPDCGRETVPGARFCGKCQRAL